MESILKDITPARNLLSISSHVVHGSVGNDALQFPLNLRNWNVDCVYTTNLSNHPGHQQFTNVKVEPALVKDLIQGLEEMDILNEYEAIVLGYIGSFENLEYIWNNVLFKANKEVKIILDPIMGDNDRVYVDERIVETYKSLLARSEITVDLIVPNQFEIEILTGIKVSSWKDIKKILNSFHSAYPSIQNVVITSVIIDGKMYCIGSDKQKVCYLEVDEIDAVFSGSGDLFLGILTDEFITTNGDLELSLSRTLIVIENVLKLTHALSKNDRSVKTINEKVYIPDLRLVESKGILRDGDEAREVRYLN